MFEMRSGRGNYSLNSGGPKKDRNSKPAPTSSELTESGSSPSTPIVVRSSQSQSVSQPGTHRQGTGERQGSSSLSGVVGASSLTPDFKYRTVIALSNDNNNANSGSVIERAAEANYNSSDLTSSTSRVSTPSANCGDRHDTGSRMLVIDPTVGVERRARDSARVDRNGLTTSSSYYSASLQHPLYFSAERVNEEDIQRTSFCDEPLLSPSRKTSARPTYSNGSGTEKVPARSLSLAASSYSSRNVDYNQNHPANRNSVPNDCVCESTDFTSNGLLQDSNKSAILTGQAQSFKETTSARSEHRLDGMASLNTTKKHNLVYESRSSPSTSSTRSISRDIITNDAISTKKSATLPVASRTPSFLHQSATLPASTTKITNGGHTYSKESEANNVVYNSHGTGSVGSLFRGSSNFDSIGIKREANSIFLPAVCRSNSGAGNRPTTNGNSVLRNSHDSEVKDVDDVDDTSHPFFSRDIASGEEMPIVSSTGTVRGVKNRVKAGIEVIVSKLDGKNHKDYRSLEKDRIVLYTTSVKVVRETHDKCLAVKKILQNHRVEFEERDVFLSKELYHELVERLNNEHVELPQVFADGIHLGDFQEVHSLNERRILRKIFQIFKKLDGNAACEKCGGFLYVNCTSCHGSKKSHRNTFTEEFCALRCTACDENGLVRCDMCNITASPKSSVYSKECNSSRSSVSGSECNGDSNNNNNNNCYSPRNGSLSSGQSSYNGGSLNGNSYSNGQTPQKPAARF